MTCLSCGGQMDTRVENHRYRESGLKSVTLLGVEVNRCRICGEQEVAIPAIEKLHGAIAGALIRKRARLTAEEIKFLRKYLGWSGADFAKRMGKTPETVSRWENAALTMDPAADRLLRLMVATRAPVSDYTVDVLAHIAAAVARPRSVRLDLKPDWKGWECHLDAKVLVVGDGSVDDAGS
jgi:putative zinc finger/helix-turn-helix YgiT family protein